VPVEAVIPDGWGWTELSIRGEGLVSWRSIDGDWWDEPAGSAVAAPASAGADQSADMLAIDDSLSTIRQRRNLATRRGHPASVSHGNPAASLLRQTLPSMGKMEEYSFEMSNTSVETATPLTPISSSMSTPKATSRRSTPSPAHFASSTPGPVHVAADIQMRRPVRGPPPAKLFDLEYDEDGGSLLLEGTLVPCSKVMLVSTGLPMAVPFVRVDTAEEGDRICEVECRGRIGGQTAEVDLGAGDAGWFRWTDAESRLLPDEKARVDGDVEVRMVRDVWGGVTVKMSFVWPRRAKEMGWTVPSADVRLTRATQRGGVLSWAASVVDGQTEVRVGRGDRGGGGAEAGRVEVTYETRLTESVLPVPAFEGDGRMIVHLRGDCGESIPRERSIVGTR